MNGLFPMEMKLLDVLRAAPLGLTRAEIVDALYADDPDGGPDGADNCVRIYICRMRRRLPPEMRIVRFNGCMRYVLIERDRESHWTPLDMLTPQQRRIFDLVARRPGIFSRRVSEVLGMNQLNISAQVYKANKTLAVFGIRIAGESYHGFTIEMPTEKSHAP